MDRKGAWQDYQDNEDGDWYDFANRFWPYEPREDLDGDEEKQTNKRRKKQC